MVRSLSRERGMPGLLEEKPRTGRPKKVRVETVAKLQQELRDTEGFSSYKEIRLWRVLLAGLKASYSTIYRLIKYELKAKLKVVRPHHER